MKQPIRSAALACLVATFGLLSACGGGGGGCSSVLLGSVATSSCGSSTPATTAPVAVNQPPIARAGSDRSVVTGSLVTLSASESNDPDGDPLTYEWTLVSRPPGSSPAAQGLLTARPSFTADVDGSFVFSLRVSDGKVWSNSVFVTVLASAINLPPVALITAPSQALVNAKVTLDGTGSSDVNRDELRFRWSLISKPTGSGAILSSVSDPRPSFTPDQPGAYVFGLQVSDGRLSSTTEYVTVNAGVANLPPEAGVGPDLLYVARNDTVTLDGTSSRDPNRDPLTFKWTFISKPVSSLAVPTPADSARPSFKADLTGVYVLSLVVSDGKLESKPQYVTVVASDANVAPKAVAGDNRQVLTGSTVTLDGSASSDPNKGDTLSYLWNLVARPDGSKASLSSQTSPKPTFQADQKGLYVASLTVFDGKLYSPASVVTISADTANGKPTAKAGSAQEVKVGSTVTLSGIESSDPDKDLLKFQWSFVTAPGATKPNLAGDTLPIAQFTPTQSGTYVLSLIVNDGKVDSDPAYLTITATSGNARPVAVPGNNYPPQKPGQQYVLNGKSSFDPDGNTPLKYSWRLISQPKDSKLTALMGDKTDQPSLIPDVNGAYVVGLTVTDALGAVSEEVNTVLSVDSGPVPPVAVAKIVGQEQVVVGAAVQLDGTGSSDLNGDPLRYEWGIVSAPDGSKARDELEKIKNAAKPILVADKPGIYVVVLVVMAGGDTSDPVVLYIKAQ